MWAGLMSSADHASCDHINLYYNVGGKLQNYCTNYIQSYRIHCMGCIYDQVSILWLFAWWLSGMAGYPCRLYIEFGVHWPCIWVYICALVVYCRRLTSSPDNLMFFHSLMTYSCMSWKVQVKSWIVLATIHYVDKNHILNYIETINACQRFNMSVVNM